MNILVKLRLISYRRLNIIVKPKGIYVNLDIWLCIVKYSYNLNFNFIYSFKKKREIDIIWCVA